MASIRDNNEKAAKRLLKSGRASTKDILTLSFGEWPPRGLDINPAVPHAQEVVFKSLVREAASYRKKRNRFFPRVRHIVTMPLRVIGEVIAINGRATLGGERAISINKLMCASLPRLFGRSSLVPTLSHEGIHTLQGDNYYRAAEVFGQRGAQRIWQQGNTNSNMILDALKNYDSTFRKSFLRRVFNRVGGHKRIGYLKTGNETQAFLHEALAKGYREWEKMPQDSAELWQALISLGLKPPPAVKTYLDALPPDAPSRVFAKKVHCESGHNISQVNRSLSHEGREFFWRTTIPMLYADLIEMYGDRKGRERFGFGENVKGQIQEAAFGAGKQSPPQPKAA